jgi:xanthine dehydrogenase molybdopterin-binding subunit B
MRMTGKRHPYSSDFKIGFDKDLKIVAYEATFHQNAGASADLSPAVMERTLFHATNAYHVPNVDVTAYCCRTNLPPNTAFRGFGGPQGMFVMEAAIAKAAQELGVSAREIQKRNLIKEGSEFSYGQIADHVLAKDAWDLAETSFDFDKQQGEIDAFNAKSETHKKGMAIMPICFGISFTNTPMNHARALVHVYQDGSVGVSTGGVEMGQGLNTKMVQVAAAVFGIGVERIKLESTNTTRVANTSPSAASATADLNGKALEIGCNAILERIREKASRILKSKPEAITIENEAVLNNGHPTDLDWKKLIHAAHWDRVNLSESGHYATPNIHYRQDEGERSSVRVPRLWHRSGDGHGGLHSRHVRDRCGEAGPRLRQAHERCGGHRPDRRRCGAGPRLDDDGGDRLQRQRQAPEQRAEHLQGAGHPQRTEGDHDRGATDRRPPAGDPPQQGRGRAAVDVRHRRVLRDRECGAGVQPEVCGEA